MIKKNVVKFLGYKVKDKVTGTKGIVTSMSFDLYGCIQAIVTNEKNESCWFDISRLKILSNNPVLEIPNYDKGYIAAGKKGATEKPEQVSLMP